MDSLVGWETGNYDIFVPKSVYKGTGGLFDILNRHGSNALAYLAHPNSTDYNDLLNGSFDAAADNAVVGSAVESGPAFSTNTTYTNPATSMSYLTYYRNMLSKGYHLGPVIDHDNHNMTFGHTAKTRLVVMAPALNENELLVGMRNMRFYASQDCGARLTYTINTQPLGTVITQSGAPNITLSSTGTASAITSVVIMSGVPGSGTAATALTSFTSGNFTHTDNTLANGNQRYYYLDITEADGSRIVTAPIWYTRNDAIQNRPAPVTSFFTVNETEKVILKWTTQFEEPGQQFEIFRSADEGRTYASLGLLQGKGNEMAMQSYSITDNDPQSGVSYYRLVQRNSTGEIRFSDIKVVNRSKAASSWFTVYPNPVQGILSINLNAAKPGMTKAEIFDMNGRRWLVQQYAVVAGGQVLSLDMSRLGQGAYLIKITQDGVSSSRLVNKF